MKIFKYLFLIVVLITSCTSMKDVFVDHHRPQTEQNLSKIETAVVQLEASSSTRRNELSSARNLISGMEKEAAADADFSGQLIAWSGRLAILEGRYSEAQRLHRQSNTVSPGNIPAIILGVRLEGDPVKRLEIIERELALLGQRSSGIGELNIERGRAFFELDRFLEAVGAFDVAFSSGIEKVYNDSYGTVRNRAWELRNTSGVDAGTRDLLGRDTMSWNDCINLAKNETQLLRFLTAGRNISDAELFARLVERGFIPASQDISISEWSNLQPKATDAVTRAGAAYFVWHLRAESRGDRGLLSRYSLRYATVRNPRSPIADVPLLSPFFDSILGCVETELMSLPDGRNFRPGQAIRAAELLTILKKVDN